MDAIRAIRNRRAEMNVPPSRKAKVYVATKFADTFRDGTQFIQKLASASEVEVAESFEIEGAVNIVTADAKIYIPMDELVDREKELARLNKELEQVKKRLAQSEGKLNNQGFVAKAPEAVIEKVKGQAAKEREQIALIEAAIAAPGDQLSTCGEGGDDDHGGKDASRAVRILQCAHIADHEIVAKALFTRTPAIWRL